MKKTNWLSLLLALMMCLLLLPAGAEAETVMETVTVSVTPTVDLPDNDEIFAAYVEREMYDYGASTFGTAAGMRLGTIDKAFYDVLKKEIEAVAANGGSTVFAVSGIDGMKTEWTNTELGVESIAAADIETVKAAFEKQFNLSKIVDALLNDCPYDLYWYEKNNAEATKMAYRVSQSGVDNDGVVTWTTATITELTFSFAVAADYEDGNNNTVTSDVARVALAKQNAAAFVNGSSMSALAADEKLAAYKDEICDLVTYNHTAAEDNTTPYGDPWQLIYVFDGDASTNVVCEGYAKAFQYLCDLSGFTDIYCYSVSGTMKGGTGAGPHMWNIVQMNGGNYLVDVTNCDEGTVGYSDELFMISTPASGTWNDMTNGYIINAGTTPITYIYDAEEIAFWGDDVLKLGEPAHTHTWGEVSYAWSDDYTSCTAQRICSGCTAAETASAGVSSAVTITATCTVEGEITYTAAFDETWAVDQTVPVKTDKDAANHTSSEFTYVANGDGQTHAKKYACCGVSASESEACSGGATTCTEQAVCEYCQTNYGEAPSHSTAAEGDKAATCIELAYCSVCQQNYGETDAANHASSEFTYSVISGDKSQHNKVRDCCGETVAEAHTEKAAVKENEVPASCGKDGSYDNVVYCSVCDAELSREPVTLSATGAHSYTVKVENSETPATCVATGSVTMKCRGCDATEVQELSVNAGNHASIITDAAVAPACESTGLTEGSHCEACNTVIVAQQTVAATGHDYETVTTDPTCTEQGYTTYTCSNCGDSYKDTYVNANGHSYGEGEIITAPTCTAVGTKTYTCSVCKSTKTEEVPATGHDYETVITDPTCTEQGYTTYTCSNCGDSYKNTYVDANGHSYGEWGITTEATCTKSGVETRKCTNCEAIETHEISAKGHDLQPTEAQDATCTESGNSAYYTCSACGLYFSDAEGKTTIEQNSWIIEATGHTMQPTAAVEPTCTAAGSNAYYTCSVCEKVFKDAAGEMETTVEAESLPIVAHSYSEPTFAWADDNTCTATYTCTVGNESQNVRCEIASATEDATCTTPGKVTYTATVVIGEKTHTSEKIVDGQALGHAYGDPVFNWSQSAQRSAAYQATAAFACTRCDETTDGHTLTMNADVVQTASTEGNCQTKSSISYTASVTLNGKTYTENKTVEGELGDHQLARVEAAEPTCTMEGRIEHYACSVCKALFEDENGTTPIDAASTVVPTAEHTAGDPVTENREEATCTVAGSYDEVVYCTECEAQISRETIKVPAKGHSFGEWKISTEATCTEKGVRTRQCTGCDATETEDISAKGHTLQPVEAKAATCTEPGHSAYYACGNCGKAFTDEAGQQETTVEAEIIAALGHTYGEPVFTWAEDGKSASAAIVCSVCDEQTEGHILSANADVMVRTSTAGDCQTVGTATYTASVVLNGTTYEEEKTVEGAYGPHKLALTEAQASTCTAAGNSAYYTCERCGAFFSDEAGMTEIEKDSWVIAAKGHAMTSVEAKAATCTEPGHSAYYACGNCGKAFKDEAGQQETTVEAVTIPATGEHSYSVEVADTRVEPTCAEAGSVLMKCAACEATQEQVLPIKPENHTENTEIKDAADVSCAEDGYTGDTYCKDCGVKLESGETIPATGEHNYATAKEKVDATCTEDGYVIMACGCGAEKTTTLEATGHAYEPVVTEPTCTAEGYTTHTCSSCGDHYVDSAVAAKGHTPAEAVKEKEVPASCGTDGSYDSVVYCSVCKTHEISRETVIVPATGEHVYAEETKRINPTCTEDGYVIMACGCGETTQTTLPATGHTPGEAVKEKETAANCTTAGSYDSVVNCATCSEEMSRETVSIDAVGHIDANADGVCDACEAELEVPVTYTVTVHGGSGAGSYAEGASVSITADAPESGRQFAGWTGAEGLTFTSGGVTVASSIFTMPARDVELTAAYEDAAPAGCVITFNANGGTGAMDAVTVTAGAAFALPECGFTAPEGQQFAGWALSADGAAIASPAAFAADTTLYAVWEAIPAAEEETPVINQTSSADVAAQEGGAVTMTVSAVNAARYQWYVNSGSGWVAIPGANNASYTVSVNAETSGTQYYCQVSNENGSTSSQIFQLRVLAPETVPQTGDDAQLGLWFVLMLLSAAGMTALAADRKRKAN